MKMQDIITESRLSEFASGGGEDSGPFAYGMALKEMAKLYAEGNYDIPGSTSASQNESDAYEINACAEIFLTKGMEAGREAYMMIDDVVQEEMDSFLADQGFNVDNDIYAEYKKDVERWNNSPAGKAQAQKNAERDAEWDSGKAERDANLVVISAVDSKTQLPEFNKIMFDQRSVPAGQLQSKIKASIAELQKEFATYKKSHEGEKIIKVTIGGKPVG
jgi:hypothetical protein